MSENEGLADLWKSRTEDMHISRDNVPGMGLGASKQATHWAWRGMMFEEALQPGYEDLRNAFIACLVAADGKRPEGRPKIDPIQSVDARRAFACWQLLWKLRRIKGRPDWLCSTRELIRLVRLGEEILDVPKNDRFFPPRPVKALAESVARGKRKLEIDKKWMSERCEEIERL